MRLGESLALRNRRSIAGVGLLVMALATAPATAREPLTSNSASTPGARFRECGACPEMVVLPAGNFTMGSPDTERGRFKKEGPEHRVTIARPLAMAVHLVTRGEWRRFVRATGRKDPEACRIYDVSFADHDLVRVYGKNWRRPHFAQTDKHPVVCVTWDDARAYAEWVNRQMGAPGGVGLYRLPTEAEWEYAARAGTTTPYYWGSEISRAQANYGPETLPFAPVASGADRWKYTSPVGAFPANPFGLHDMAGNVWQFTLDCWHETYEGAPIDGSARADGKCDERAVRGGSWFKVPAGERTAMRGQGKVADLKGNHEIGFRLVRDLEPQ